MNRRITLSVVGTAFAALALAGPATAHRHPSPQSVAKHVRNADQALGRSPRGRKRA